MAWPRSLVLLALLLVPRPAPAEPASLDVALAVDTSGSVAKSRGARDAAVRGLLDALPPGARLSLHAFDVEPRLVLPAGSARDDVRRAAARLAANGRSTALNDAIYDATRALADAAGARAVVVVTDGVDQNSALDVTDGVAAAREAGVPVFFVGVGRVTDRPLRRIAKLTGGTYFPPRTRPGVVAAAVTRGARAPRVAPAPPAPPTTPVAEPKAATPTPVDEPRLPAPRPSRAWMWLLLGALTIAGLGLGVAAMMLRPSRAAAVPPPPPAPEPPVSGTLATRLEQIAPVERTMVLTMRPLLHAVRGAASGRLYEVSRQRATLIGRAPGNDVVLDDLAVSSQHCRIRPAEDGGFEVLDVGSTNGTFVNEKRVTRQLLAPGDNVKVGETVLQFRLDHAGDA